MTLILSFAIGAIQVIAPDHWVPAAILAWQRRWGLASQLAFSVLALLLHCAGGAVIYFVFREWLLKLDGTAFFVFVAAGLTLTAILRAARFSSSQNTVYSHPLSLWGIASALGLLGPSEALLPVLMRAGHGGGGYALPFISFFAGAALVGVPLMALGTALCNRPLWFSRSVWMARRRLVLLPIATGLAVAYLI